jgi:hypothetical protein
MTSRIRASGNDASQGKNRGGTPGNLFHRERWNKSTGLNVLNVTGDMAFQEINAG